MTAFGFFAAFAGAGVSGVENGWGVGFGGDPVEGASPVGVPDVGGLDGPGLATAKVRAKRRVAGRRTEQERRQRAQNMARFNCVN